MNLQIKAATLKFSIICSLVGIGWYLTAITALLLGLCGREKQISCGIISLSLFLVTVFFKTRVLITYPWYEQQARAKIIYYVLSRNHRRTEWQGWVELEDCPEQRTFQDCGWWRFFFCLIFFCILSHYLNNVKNHNGYHFVFVYWENSFMTL